MNHRIYTVTLILFILTSCSKFAPQSKEEEKSEELSTTSYIDWVGVRQSLLAINPDSNEFTSPSFSRAGMVTSKQPLATAAGNEMLEAGGNAADAAIATAYAISVLRPGMNSIGGRGQILVRTTDGEFHGYSGHTKVPAAYEVPDEEVDNSYTKIGVPGIVASLERLYEEHATLPRAKLMEPAIRYAREGYRLIEVEQVMHNIVHKKIKDDPGFRQGILRPDGSPRIAGELLAQPQLANTLEKIAEQGADGFYKGEVAQKIAQHVQENGGFLTEQDLLDYVAEDGRYISTVYRGYEIHSMAAPAGGGAVIKALNILENFDLPNMSKGDWGIVVSQALQMVFESNWRGDKVAELQAEETKEWASEQAGRILVPPFTTENTALTALQEAGNTPALAEQGRFTTHFVAADCAGMVVSITQTVGDVFGAKVVTPGLGFVYAETMRNPLLSEAIAVSETPGSYPATYIAPTIVTKDGELVMALGAAGGIRIVTGIVQTISRYIDQGMPLSEAELAPRVHPAGNTGDDQSDSAPVRFTVENFGERVWSSETKNYWQEVGVEAKNDPSFTFGMVNAVEYANDTGQWTGVAQPRLGGSAQGPKLDSCAILANQ